jgi:hypothetical protein
VLLQEKKLNDNTLCVLCKQGNRALVVRSKSSVGRQETTFDKLFDEYVENAPVMKRGWAFQERILASRVLHFCDWLNFFECNTMRASEYHPDGLHYPEKRHLRADGTLRTPRELVNLVTMDDSYVQEYQTVRRGGQVGPGRSVPTYTLVIPMKVLNRNFRLQTRRDWSSFVQQL